MYESTKSKDSELQKTLQSILDVRNVDIPPYERCDFAITIKENDNIIGGVTGYSVWNWFYIDLIAVNVAHQNKGFGTELLKRAEKEALRRKCIGIWLHTMSFQAPEFYKSAGYEMFGEMNDCPVGHKRLFMSKMLKNEKV